MAVVTVSSEMGSGGPEIGSALAQRLGYRYVDREVISEAARRYGLPEHKLADLDERKPSLFQRFDVETRRYMLGTQTALCDFATTDNVVLMGRGGQWLLRGIPHVLRVRITAPFDVRVRRLADKRQGQRGQGSPRAFADMVREDDMGRSGRMRYLYDVDIEDASLYDVVIGTTTVTIESAVEILTRLVQRAELATTPEGQALCADRALAAKVELALAASAKTRKLRVIVTAQNGVVTLEGAADLWDAAGIARQVPGVIEVDTKEREVPPIAPFPT